MKKINILLKKNNKLTIPDNRNEIREVLPNLFISTSNKTDMFVADNKLIFFDGRLDGTDKIKDKLGISAKIKNEDLILKMHKQFGSNFINQLSGAYCFVIINLDNGVLLAATDQMAVSPLYFTDTADYIIISNCLKSIAYFFDKPKADPEVLKDYLVQSYPRAGRTIYKDVSITNPCERITVSNGKLSVDKYHQYKKTKDITNVEKAKDETKEIFQQIIRKQLDILPKEISFSLSGGLDSSSIVCVANSMREDRCFVTHSAKFAGLNPEEKLLADETKYIEAVKEKINATNYYHQFKKYDYLEYLDFISSFDEPILGSTMYINKSILEKNVNLGIKHHFEGTFGDEIISHGYEKLMYLGSRFRFKQLFIEEKKLRVNRGLKFSYIKSIKDNFIKAYLPIWLMKLYRKILGTNKSTLDKITKKSFLKNHSDHFEMINGYHPSVKNKKINDNLHEIVINEPVISYGARLYKKLGQKFGVEILLPFLDKSLIDYSLDVSPQVKLRNGFDRYHFRKAMNGIIPDSIFKRSTKADISPIFLKVFGSLDKATLEHLIFSGESCLDICLEKEKTLNLINEYYETKNSSLAIILNRIASLRLWLQKNDL